MQPAHYLYQESSNQNVQCTYSTSHDSISSKWRGLQDISQHRRFVPQDVSHPPLRRFTPVAVTTCPSFRRFAPIFIRRFAPWASRFALFLIRRFAPYSAERSQNVPDLLLLYENICITFGEYSISGNIIHMSYECFQFNNSQSIPDFFLS